jgi:hypothetical protein
MICLITYLQRKREQEKRGEMIHISCLGCGERKEKKKKEKEKKKKKDFFLSPFSSIVLLGALGFAGAALAADQAALVLARLHHVVVCSVCHGIDMRGTLQLGAAAVVALHLGRVDGQLAEGIDRHQDVSNVCLGSEAKKRKKNKD